MRYGLSARSSTAIRYTSLERLRLLAYLGEHWVAIAALAISAFLLYRDHLTPFKLEVRSAGRATVARNPFSEGLKQGCVLADLIFTNLGTKRGVVEDVALSVQSIAGLTLLRSHSIVLDRTINLAQGLPPPSLEPFTGFALSKEEAVVRRLLFLPTDQAAAFEISPGKYSAGIWTRSSPSPDSWSSHGAISFTVDGWPGSGGYSIRWRFCRPLARHARSGVSTSGFRAIRT